MSQAIKIGKKATKRKLEERRVIPLAPVHTIPLAPAESDNEVSESDENANVSVNEPVEAVTEMESESEIESEVEVDAESLTSLPRCRSPERKIAKVGKLPHLQEFGKYIPRLQLAKFREWMELVNATLTFAVGWDEHSKFNWFWLACGDNIRNVATTFNLKPTSSVCPFSDLMQRLDAHFMSLTDPTLDNRALNSCKQEPGETTNDFYLRLTLLVRHMNVDSDRLR